MPYSGKGDTRLKRDTATFLIGPIAPPWPSSVDVHDGTDRAAPVSSVPELLNLLPDHPVPQQRGL